MHGLRTSLSAVLPVDVGRCGAEIGQEFVAANREPAPVRPWERLQVLFNLKMGQTWEMKDGAIRAKAGDLWGRREHFWPAALLNSCPHAGHETPAGVGGPQARGVQTPQVTAGLTAVGRL